VADAAVRRLLIDVMIDVRECNDHELTKELAAKLPSFIDLSNILLTPSDTHAVGCVLSHVTKQVDKLSLNRCMLSTKSFQNISVAIVSMPGKVSSFVCSGVMTATK